MSVLKPKQKMGELPSELVDEILTRVPVRGLVRFRCVCKRWKSLFKDKEFINKHKTYAPRKFLWVSDDIPPRSVVYEHDSNGAPRMRVDNPDLSSGDERLLDLREIIGHCNGLFCLRLHDRSLAVWNPSLRDFRNIQVADSLCIDDDYMIGFGYDHSIDDFKIVLLSPGSSEGPENPPQVDIYTLKSDSRTIQFPSTQYPIWVCHIKEGTLLGGSIFWLVTDLSSGDVSETIMSFDLVSETFHSFSCPPIEDEAYRNLMVVKGRLGMVDLWLDETNCKMVLWSANEDRSWSKLIDIAMTGMGMPIHDWMFDDVLDSETDDAKILIRMVNKTEKAMKLIAYSVVENTFREVENSASPESDLSHEYIETLVSPRGF